MSEVYIPKDSVLVCKKCGDKILKAAKDLHRYDQKNKSSNYIGIQRDIKSHTTMSCLCGWSYEEMKKEWFVKEN